MNKLNRTLGLLAALVAVVVGAWLYQPARFRDGASGPPALSPPATLSSAPTAGPRQPAAPASSRAEANLGTPAPPPATPTVAEPATGLAPDTVPPALRPLVDRLRQPDPDQRAQAVDDLGFADEPGAEPFVINTLLNDPSAAVRAAAAAALETHDSDNAVTALGYGLTDPEEDVREQALLSLSAIRTAAVETSLRALLDAGRLEPETATEVRVFLDRYYPRKDPFVDVAQP